MVCSLLLIYEVTVSLRTWRHACCKPFVLQGDSDLARGALACRQHSCFSCMSFKSTLVLVYSGSRDWTWSWYFCRCVTCFILGYQSTFPRRILGFSNLVAALFVGKGKLFWFNYWLFLCWNFNLNLYLSSRITVLWLWQIHSISVSETMPVQ